MSDLDRIETNFRLTLITQREQSLLLQQVATAMTGISTQVADMAVQIAAQMTALSTQMTAVAAKVEQVARKGEETADRLEDAIQVIHSFAEGQADLRRTVAECVRRLDVLEGKKAS